jgi:hypothetical protein
MNSSSDVLDSENEIHSSETANTHGNSGQASQDQPLSGKVAMGISVLGVSIFLAYFALKKSLASMNPQTKDNVAQFGRLVMSAFLDCVLNTKF